MKNKLICLFLLLIIFFRVSIYLSRKIENENKEDKIQVISKTITNNKTATEYIKELQGLECDITRLIKENDGWKVSFEFLGSKEKVLEILKSIEKYEILTYDLSANKVDIKLIAELYCK